MGVSGNLGLPVGYVDDTELNATLTFAGASFASLGVDAANDPYVYMLSGSGDTLTLTFETAVIPLPAGLPLFAAGLGLLALLRRRG